MIIMMIMIIIIIIIILICFEMKTVCVCMFWGQHALRANTRSAILTANNYIN